MPLPATTNEPVVEIVDRVQFDAMFVRQYDHCKRIAEGHLRGERNSISVTATDLVHDIYDSLWATVRQETIRCWDALVCTMLRRRLIERARRRNTVKRGGDRTRCSVNAAEATISQASTLPVFELYDLVEQLEKTEPRKAEFIRLKLVGYSNTEICREMNIAPSTASKLLKFARGFLKDKYLD